MMAASSMSSFLALELPSFSVFKAARYAGPGALVACAVARFLCAPSSLRAQGEFVWMKVAFN